MTVIKENAVYEHVKTGNKYRLICVGKHSETLEELVVYEALYENPVGKIWVRSKETFVGEAQSPDGTFHPRFRFVAENT